MPEPVAPYSAGFAERYDLHWGSFAPAAAAAVLAYVRRRRPGVALHLLDLGCGTGLADEVFCDHGLRVTGVDLSEPMLAVARRRLARFDKQTAAWVRGDLAAADGGREPAYDVVVSLFDTLNHLPDAATLARCLQAAAVVARPGAVLIADLNTRRGLSGWDEPLDIDDPAGPITVRGTVEGGGERAHLVITGYDPTGQEQFAERQTEISHPLTAVAAAATAAGWVVDRWASYTDLEVAVDDPEARRRAVLVAHRRT